MALWFAPLPSGKVFHVDEFNIFPAGHQPPNYYVEAAELREWRKRYEEVTQQRGPQDIGKGSHGWPPFLRFSSTSSGPDLRFEESIAEQEWQPAQGREERGLLGPQLPAPVTSRRRGEIKRAKSGAGGDRAAAASTEGGAVAQGVAETAEATVKAGTAMPL